MMAGMLTLINVFFVENRMVVFEFFVLFLKWYFLDGEVYDCSWSLIFLFFVTRVFDVHILHVQNMYLADTFNNRIVWVPATKVDMFLSRSIHHNFNLPCY